MLAWLVARQIMGRVCIDANPGAAQKSFLSNLPPVANIAHRGASKSAAEHTLAAYELALSRGADVLELDLRATSDEVLLLAHDADLERTLGIPLTLISTPWVEIRARTGDRAPLRLEQVLQKFGTARLNLELKDDRPSAARALVDTLHAHNAEDRVLVASRHHHMLVEFRKLSQGRIATSASMREVLTFRFCQLMGRSCHTPFAALQIPPLGWLGLTGSEFISHAHSQGIAVHFWTVDDPARQRELIAAGADGIMTNEPETLAKVLGSRGDSRGPR